MSSPISSPQFWSKGYFIRANTLIAFLVVVLLGSFLLIACGGSSTVETGATFDLAEASEDEVRAVLVLAVREKCSESGVGISAGLASALRSVESAGAKKFPTSWGFRIDGRSLRVFPSGKVTGDLLGDLVARC